MATDLLVEGMQLMVAGMGAVFVFLTLLVFATVLMSRSVLHFQRLTAVDEVLEDGDLHDLEVAAITAAIAEHRRIVRRTK